MSGGDWGGAIWIELKLAVCKLTVLSQIGYTISLTPTPWWLLPYALSLFSLLLADLFTVL